MAIFSRIKNFVSGETILASDTNAEFNNILNNMKSESIYSASVSSGVPDVTQMRTTANPGTVGSESIPTDLREEVRQLKYMISQIVGGAQWYSAPEVNINGAFPIQTANIGDTQVTTGKIANDAVTADKLADDASVDANRAVTTNHIRDNAITQAKIASNSIGDVQIQDANVTLNKLAANSVNASKIVDGSVGTSELANNSVTVDKTAALNFQGSAVLTNSSTSSFISVGSVSGSAAGSVSKNIVSLITLEPSGNNSIAYFTYSQDFEVIIQDGAGGQTWRFPFLANQNIGSLVVTTSESATAAYTYSVSIQTMSGVGTANVQNYRFRRLPLV